MLLVVNELLWHTGISYQQFPLLVLMYLQPRPLVPSALFKPCKITDNFVQGQSGEFSNGGI